jgi:RNA polymerase sigma factor (sigma-70 family)
MVGRGRNPVAAAGAYQQAGTLIPAMTPDDDSDDELMRAFASGDARAFERLYARHQAPLYRFVRRLLGRAAAAQADEVFQDAWMKLIQQRHDWKPQGAALRTWLFTLAHHRAVDCLRKSGREVSAEPEEGAPWEPAASPWAGWPEPVAGGADDQVFWRAAGHKLLDCLEGLPLPQKTAFLLHHEDGLAVDEVARALEVGFETAKTRLRYAMSKLRTCMGAYLPAKANAA